MRTMDNEHRLYELGQNLSKPARLSICQTQPKLGGVHRLSCFQGFLLFPCLVSNRIPPGGFCHLNQNQTHNLIHSFQVIDFEPDFWEEVKNWNGRLRFQIQIQVEESLEQFYLHCLLPELADPRFSIILLLYFCYPFIIDPCGWVRSY